MKVELVNFRKAIGPGGVKAFADVSFGDANYSMVVKGFTVLEGKGKRLLVCLPRKVGRDGRWLDVIMPDEKLKECIENIILDAYEYDSGAG